MMMLIITKNTMAMYSVKYKPASRGRAWTTSSIEHRRIQQHSQVQVRTTLSSSYAKSPSEKRSTVDKEDAKL